MDAGAAVIAEEPPYTTLLALGLAHLNAFESDARHVERISQTWGDRATVFSDFLFDGTQRNLYLASAPSGMTSLLKPHAAALQFFNGFEVFGQVERVERVQTRRLDDIAAVPELDLVKLDVQGAELTVLKNGVAKLATCLAVQLEVSWIALYEDQPSFGEVDTWMREQGFAPHALPHVKRWAIAPTVFGNNIHVGGNQLLEADVVYVRDPLRLNLLTEAMLKKLAVIAHFCFCSFDLCVRVLLELARRGALPANAAEQYLAGQDAA
jgi:FkbM family methyltransferase